MLNTVLRKIKFLVGNTAKLDNIQLALGRIERRQLELLQHNTAAQWEFQVTSQWGEDGIIQFLINKIAVKQKVFVEFGVENYSEANTRFLLQNNYWSGLVIDGSEKNIEKIKASDLYWRYNLKAHEAFITKDNIDELITTNGIRGEIGLLSVDIDGNDYWVWEAIKSIEPQIVVCEYNSLFGPTAKVSVPYQSDFIRNTGNKPNTYYGASISALTFLAQKKGYELVAGNQAGNNVFFVKRACLGDLKPISPDDAYRAASFRESRNPDGTLSFKNHEDARLELLGFPAIEVETNRQILLKDVI
jgi:hypothetical protein